MFDGYYSVSFNQSIVNCAYSALRWLPEVRPPVYRPVRADLVDGRDLESLVRDLLATRHLLIGSQRSSQRPEDGAIIQFSAIGWDISGIIGQKGAVLVDATKPYDLLLVLEDGLAPGVSLISVQAA